MLTLTAIRKLADDWADILTSAKVFIEKFGNVFLSEKSPELLKSWFILFAVDYLKNFYTI